MHPRPALIYSGTPFATSPLILQDFPPEGLNFTEIMGKHLLSTGNPFSQTGGRVLRYSFFFWMGGSMKTNDRDGSFYLGREYDLEEQKLTDKLVHYDPRNLTTHGVVVGMTGSGKTGLCISLVEEAALQQIPCIVVDLKGDLSNLLLQFPDLNPQDFEPWIDPNEARRHNNTVEEHAAGVAKTWREGLQAWDQNPERIIELQEKSQWRIYTPGSEAGLPVSVIQNFAAPQNTLDREMLNDRVASTTTAILGLTNVASDPVQSREHILIANLLLHAWLEGRDLDLPHLINEITHPPLQRIGTFDIDMFYPEDDRLALALALNNLLASPTFSGWVNGEPFDLGRMMYDAQGKPRQLIFYLAHLDDSQRMFFLTLLLEEFLTWTRSQSGSSSLRALLYLDEIYGYLPPYPANPPTKKPLMTLLKQGRAFGVGVLLATQNPMDIDYKALTNAGSWFVGKLQTDRDKARLVEGLEGVSAEQGTLTDKSYLETVISSLGNQVFLLHNVHEKKPILFHTRWALSYLYGPMTRDQISQLMAPYREELRASAGGSRMMAAPQPDTTRFVGPAKKCTSCSAVLPVQAKFCMECGIELPPEVHPQADQETADREMGEAAVTSSNPVAPVNVPPILPPGLVQFFIPLNKAAQKKDEQTSVICEPRLLGFAEVIFKDRRRKFEYEHTYRLLAISPDAVRTEPWQEAEIVVDSPEPEPTWERAFWEDVPATINSPKKLKELEKAFLEFLYGHAVWYMYYNRSLGLLSKPHENREAFLDRCVQAAQEESASALAEWEEQEAGNPEDEAWKKKRQKQAERLQNLWLKKANKAQSIALTPQKKDIRVTHFGIAWAPFAPGESDEQNPTALYASGQLEPDQWRGNKPSETLEEEESTPSNTTDSVSEDYAEAASGGTTREAVAAASSETDAGR